MFNLDVPYMETERLILREICDDDAKDMFEYASLPYVGPLAGWAPHKRLSETRAIISLFADKKIYGQLGTVAIILKDENKMIGTAELHTYVAGFKAELGYTINPAYWGNGYAVEACKKIMEWGFKVLNLKRIECTSFIDNYKSQRVCEKLGFVFEGIRKKGYRLYDGSIHDLRCYGLTDTEYFSKEYQDFIKKTEE